MSQVIEEKPKNDDEPSHINLPDLNLYTAPYWLILMVAGWLYVIYQMANNPKYAAAFNQIRDGIPLTIWLAVASYIFALIIGLLMGWMRAYPPKPPESALPMGKQIKRWIHMVVYNLVSVYIEFMRGIPSLVFLLIAGFIIVPAIREPFIAFAETTWMPFYNAILQPVLDGLLNREVEVEWLGWLFKEYEVIDEITWRGRDPATAIAGLSLIYGAYLAEVFRAGIQAVPKGQIEAALSVGMTYRQTMRFIVFPQAVRAILPPLGNNFVSMIKDTSLVTILGTREITQIARQWSGSVFTYIPTYAVLSVVYLTMTVTGSLLVQLMERRLSQYNKN